MPQIVRDTPRYVSPPGYEVVDTGTATEAMQRGQLCSLGAAGWSLLPAGATEPDGVALQDYAAGEVGADFLIHGEMDGYVGLPIGDPLYPSATVAGGIQTEPTTVATADATTTVPGPVRMKATTATRIRFNLV